MTRLTSHFMQLVWLVSILFQVVLSFPVQNLVRSQYDRSICTTSILFLSSNDDEPTTTSSASMSGVEEYKNVVTKVLSNFMQRESSAAKDPLGGIDFAAPKIAPSTSLETLAQALDCELIEKEWFVTGNVNPQYFSNEFEFQDPDVQLKGIEEYARGVNKLFDQSCSRAEIQSTEVTGADRITVTWRLSGKVNIAFGLPIKPYIVYTDFTVDPSTSLITFQEDTFDLPAWDILFSALFPFVIGKLTQPPAPPVPNRDVAMPKISTTSRSTTSPSPIDDVFNFFNRK